MDDKITVVELDNGVTAVYMGDKLIYEAHDGDFRPEHLLQRLGYEAETIAGPPQFPIPEKKTDVKFY